MYSLKDKKFILAQESWVKTVHFKGRPFSSLATVHFRRTVLKMLKWQKPKKSQKEIRLSEIGKELDYIEMQIQNPTLLRLVFSSTPFNVS